VELKEFLADTSVPDTSVLKVIYLLISAYEFGLSAVGFVHDNPEGVTVVSRRSKYPVPDIGQGAPLIQSTGYFELDGEITKRVLRTPCVESDFYPLLADFSRSRANIDSHSVIGDARHAGEVDAIDTMHDCRRLFDYVETVCGLLQNTNTKRRAAVVAVVRSLRGNLNPRRCLRAMSDLVSTVPCVRRRKKDHAACTTTNVANNTTNVANNTNNVDNNNGDSGGGKKVVRVRTAGELLVIMRETGTYHASNWTINGAEIETFFTFSGKRYVVRADLDRIDGDASDVRSRFGV
jgi:hypothetical protein